MLSIAVERKFKMPNLNARRTKRWPPSLSHDRFLFAFFQFQNQQKRTNLYLCGCLDS